MKITVGELIEQLSLFPGQLPICFGGSPDGLEFNGVRSRGDIVQIDFTQAVYRSSEGVMVIQEFEKPSTK